MLLRISCLEDLVEPVCVRVGRIVRHAGVIQAVRIEGFLFPEVDVALGEHPTGVDIVARLVDELHVPGVVGHEVELIVRHLDDTLVGVADLWLVG